MGDVAIPPDESVDPPAARVGPGLRVVGPVRGPDADALGDGPGAGFTSGQPWLRLGPDADARNVATQSGDPGRCSRRTGAS